jgi:hypothetical protein
MALRLAADGVQVVDEWRARRCQSPADERLVAEMLRSVADGRWQQCWRSFKDETEPDVTVIELRDGLVAHVRPWDADAEDEFTVVAISDVPAGGGR